MGLDIKIKYKTFKKRKKEEEKARKRMKAWILCVWNQTGPSMNNLNFPAVQCSVSKGDLQS